MSEPWTRQEQINYATFGTKEAPPEWNAAWEAIQALARATGCPLGKSVSDHFEALCRKAFNAEMSVD